MKLLHQRRRTECVLQFSALTPECWRELLDTEKAIKLQLRRMAAKCWMRNNNITRRGNRNDK